MQLQMQMQKNSQLKPNYDDEEEDYGSAPHLEVWGREGVQTRADQSARHLSVGSGKAVHPIAQALAQARTDFGQVCNKNPLLAFLLLRVLAFIHKR